MKKIETNNGIDGISHLVKLLRVMKITCLFLMIALVQTSASTYSQSVRLSFSLKNVMLSEVFDQIEKTSELRFFYDSGDIDFSKRITINAVDSRVDDILNSVFKNSNISYEIFDRYIIVKTKGKKSNFEKKLINGQQKSVSGKVTDSSGLPLPGVTVVLKGTTQGTITNNDGQYSLSNIPENATLLFSFVGMQSQEVIIGSQSVINIIMEVDAIGIEEVVAIGYGSLDRNKVSSSITTIKQEKIKDQLPATIDRSLEGRISGVEIKEESGAPGGGALIRIRGVGSIGGGNEPLVVIDGIPMGSYGLLQSPLSLLDPANIETIDVLKDVSATAIYGSRGSSGVILITTKSGKVGATKISFSAQGGVAQMMPSEKLDLMNAEEFATWRKENAYEKANFYGYEITLDDIPEEYRDPEKLGKGTDWQDYLTRLAPQQQYNLSVTHGTRNFKGFYSLGYINQQGIIKETGFERLNMRANMEFTPNDVIKVAMNLHPSIRWYDNYGTAWLFGTMSNPVDGPGRDDGPFEDERYFDGDIDQDIYSSGTWHGYNGLYVYQQQVDKTDFFNIDVQPYLEITPLQGLTLKTQFNLQAGNSMSEYFSSSKIGQPWAPPPVAAAGSYNTAKSIGWQFENTLHYLKSFGDHEFSALLGYTMEHYNGYSSSMSGSGYPTDYIKTLNAATTISGSTTESNWSMISYMSRLNYNYKSKYLLTGTIRRDGSSRFGLENKWGLFPSASVGWNVSKESFFPDVQWLANLKLRLSYGTSGNNAIGDYTWIPNLVGDNYTFGGSIAGGQKLGSIENSKLGWQESSEFDFGSDLTLFNGKLNFVFDYYSKITENMLWGVNMPISSGFSSMTQNIGKMRNRGLEFAINSINVSNPNFTWNTDFNISFNRNIVLDLGDVSEISGGGGITIVGEPVAMHYGYKMIGVFKDQNEIDNNPHQPNQLPGTARWADIDENGTIDARDQTIIGNPHPKFRGGLSNNIKYKNWDLNISMSFAHDYDVMSTFEEWTLNLDGSFNALRSVKNRWKSPEDPGDGQMPTSIHQTSNITKKTSHMVNNVSFLKMQNISLGYNFNRISFANQLRLFCTVQNAFLLTNYKYGNSDANAWGNDPLRMNQDFYNYPLSRTVVLGFNIEF